MTFLQQIVLFISSFVLSIVPSTQLVEGVTGQPSSFMPHMASSQDDKTISRLIYRGLFKYDILGNLVPDLAESWSISSDGLVYTVTIKDAAYWSDGSKVTSDDIIYTAFNLPDLQNVGTDKVDNRTVRFILPNEFSPFLGLLTSGVMKAQSEEDYGPLLAPTNGDFRVLRVRKSGPLVKDVVLITDDPDKKIKKLVFRYYTNEDELVLAAKLGEIDAFLSEENHPDLKDFENYKFPQQGVYFAIFFNLDKESVQSEEMRQQLEQVINKEQIIYDKGILVEGPISRSQFTDRELEFNKYDPELKGDLDKTLTITIPDLKTHRDMADRIKRIWKEKLDVDLKIETHNPETFVEDIIIPRDYELLLYGQEVSRDPGRYVNWHSTQKNENGLNLSNFEHVRADRALEEGRKALDNEDRLIHYTEFQKVINEQVPAIFLYHPYKNYYVSKYVQGIGEKYTFTVADRFLDFDNWSLLRTN